MNILNNIKSKSERDGSQLVFYSREGKMDYRTLWDESGRLAAWIESELGMNKDPIVVYGHKHPRMLVCFLACVRSGRAYCPVDISMPADRVQEIVERVDNPIVLATKELTVEGKRVISPAELEEAVAFPEVIEDSKQLSKEDTFYIIFTSGSTGKPKGVQISRDNLENYLEWSKDLGDTENEKDGGVFLNQAPFSFDLSVMDVYNSLATGATIWAVDKELQQDLPQMLTYIKEAHLTHWVSTPSFAAMCLSEPDFTQESLPDLSVFLFCGETLTKDTGRRLLERFPKAAVLNTYGPTAVSYTHLTLPTKRIV